MKSETKNPYTTGQKSLTRKQAESVIMAANSYEDKMLVLIGFTLGLRRDDLVRVEIQNINFATNEFSYLEKKKGNRIKTVPMTERLSNELRVYINSHATQGQKYLFPPRQKVSKKNVKNLKQKKLSAERKFNVNTCRQRPPIIFSMICANGLE